MDFNPDEYLAQKETGFNPDAYLSIKGGTEETLPDVSQAESLGRGLIQGGTLNFGDEIGGGAYALKDAWKKGSLSDIVSDYVKNRDEIRTNNDNAQKANPWTYGAGQLGGGVATAFVPGLNLAKGATLAKSAALGGASALGASKADLTKGEFADAAIDTGVGSALGAGAAYLGGKAAPIVDKLGGGLKKGGAMLTEAASKPTQPFGTSDLATMATGTLFGDPTGGVATTIAKRMAQPYVNKAGGYLASKTGQALENAAPFVDVFTPEIQKGMVASTNFLNQPEPGEAPQQDAPTEELDINRITEKLQSDPKTQRLIGPLQKAAQRGKEALTSTYFVLQQTDPDFQRVVRGEN